MLLHLRNYKGFLMWSNYFIYFISTTRHEISCGLTSLSVSDTVNLFNFNHPGSMQWYFIGAYVALFSMMLNLPCAYWRQLYLFTYLSSLFSFNQWHFTILMVSLISKRRKSDLSIFVYGIDFQVLTKKTLWTRSQKYCTVFL